MTLYFFGKIRFLWKTTIFLGWRLAAGAFLEVKNSVFWNLGLFGPWDFCWKSDRTNLFFGNGLIEPKNWWKAPYRIVDIPYKTQKRHFSTETVIFGQKKSACGKPPAEENGPFPRETLFGPKKKRLRQAANQKRSKMPTFFFSEKNGKKHQHLHEMVIYPTFCDDS